MRERRGRDTNAIRVAAPSYRLRPKPIRLSHPRAIVESGGPRVSVLKADASNVHYSRLASGWIAANSE